MKIFWSQEIRHQSSDSKIIGKEFFYYNPCKIKSGQQRGFVFRINNKSNIKL